MAEMDKFELRELMHQQRRELNRYDIERGLLSCLFNCAVCLRPWSYSVILSGIRKSFSGTIGKENFNNALDANTLEIKSGSEGYNELQGNATAFGFTF